MDETLDEMIRATFVDPVDLTKAGMTMDYMRFRLRYTYQQCKSAVLRVLPGVDYEDIAQQVEEHEVNL